MEFALPRLTDPDTPVLLIKVPALINPPPDSVTEPPALSRSTVPPFTNAPALISTPPGPAPSRAVPLALTVPLTLIVAALSIVTFAAETVPFTARFATPPSPNVKEPLATLKPFSVFTALALPNATKAPAVPVNLSAISAAPPVSMIASMLSNSIATVPTPNAPLTTSPFAVVLAMEPPGSVTAPNRHKVAVAPARSPSTIDRPPRAPRVIIPGENGASSRVPLFSFAVPKPEIASVLNPIRPVAEATMVAPAALIPAAFDDAR